VQPAALWWITARHRAYLDAAAQKNMRISHIIETHVQADHVSGAQRLAEVTALRSSCIEPPTSVPHTDLADEDVLDLATWHRGARHARHTPTASRCW